jgi:hypothetical protein
VLERAKPRFASRQLQLLACAAALGISVLLAGCTPQQPTVGPTTAPSSTTKPAAPAATPAPAPTFKPALAASENQDYFDWIAEGVLATDPVAPGPAFVDALAAGGFDKAQMEVTFDRTAIDLEADSIQFSVRLHEKCIIGQSGPGDSYRSIITPLLGSGACLVGVTRQIDW